MKIKVKGVLYDMPNELTFGEQADIQREFGDLNQGSLGLGTIWIAIRRVYPKTTLEDLNDAVVEIVEEDEDQRPPTNLNGNAAGVESEPATATAGTGSPVSDS